MRKLLVKGTSQTLSVAEMWERISNIEKYPERVKFCKKVMVTEVKEGGTYEDITTLLWIPLKIKHTITSVKKYKEMSYFMRLPGGGEMWMTFSIHQQKETYIQAEIMFHLGSNFWNKTVGYILEERLLSMIRHVFPEIKTMERID